MVAKEVVKISLLLCRRSSWKMLFWVIKLIFSFFYSVLSTWINRILTFFGHVNTLQPNYTIKARLTKHIEIRHYSNKIATIIKTEPVKISPRLSSSIYSILAKYFLGNNVSRTSLSLTSPVLHQNTRKSCQVAFFILSESIPEPEEPLIKIQELDGDFVCIRQTGWIYDKKVAQAKNECRSRCKEFGIRPSGNELPWIARYSPPWSLKKTWEVWIPVDLETRD